MPSLRSELSVEPIPDWQRPRDGKESRSVHFQRFEAPSQSLVCPNRGLSRASSWAIQALENLQTNRERFSYRRSRTTNSSLNLIEVGPIPDWVIDAADLPEFSSGSIQQWKDAAKAMIRDQLPYIHLHADWKDATGALRPDRSGPDRARKLILDQILEEFVLLVTPANGAFDYAINELSARRHKSR